jgi:hypothetical protein
MIVGMNGIQANVIPQRNHFLLVSWRRSLFIGPERLPHARMKSNGQDN